MKYNSKLSCAIAAILGASATAVPAGMAAEGDAAEPIEIQEVTVTAQRRSENMQDVPISVQALTGDSIRQLNVATFDDFVKYLPNVSTASLGPGQGSIFMRGLSVGVAAAQGAGSASPMPNVAVYLDDEPAILPGHNLDIYAADLERIEVLEGPQGTLFGSGAQAGVVRYITNKPKLNVTEGRVNAGYSYTAGGDPNANVDAVVNLPVIPDRLAVRAVIYSDSRGGYINNLPSTFTRQASDLGFATMLGGVVPTNSVSINNNNIAGRGINPVTYKGLRVSALYQFSEDWDALLSESYQNLDAEGVFYQMPRGSEGSTFNQNGQPLGGAPLPPLSVTLFNPSSNKDKFNNTALTINGKVGDLKVVYNGAYLDRNVEQQQDYTNYARGIYAYYYQCAGYSATSAAAGFCGSPSVTWKEKQRNTHQSHEVRLSTPDDWRIRGIAGLYWEEYKLYDTTDFNEKSVPTCSPTNNVNCFNNIQPWPTQTAIDRSVRNDEDGFLIDSTRSIVQKAAFGSVDFSVIPDKLLLTIGTRYYRFNQEHLGGNVLSFGCKVFTPTTYYGPCLTAGGTNLDTQDPNSSVYHGFRSRADLSWHVTSDALLYYTWSQGFRPGGFNRGVHKTLVVNGQYQFGTPLTYRPDTLTNNEIGFKTEWLGRRLQVNGAVYQEDWKDTIISFLDPLQGFGTLNFVTNGPNYRVRGGELQIMALPVEGLTVQTAASYNKGKQVTSPLLVNNNPASPNFGKQITTITDVYGAVGSPLAQSPEFQGNIHLRYEMPVGEYRFFVQGGAQYFGDSYSSALVINNYYMPGYTTFDASVGASMGAWNVELFSKNLGNKNASTYTTASQYILAQTVLRPRIAGVNFGYKF